ncbi:MAG TPA: response regulator [Steroidobacteraceae bacterium]|nr:response regulator [Steroidobacteraceae bacterium]
MGEKRALVVDDSKSARTFLSRILERYNIEVEGVENAEEAIEYLSHHRPDVIFMDHMMPGMDGFEAVQTIKNNPRTATIPILMYTSQEGELYLGQARALGAVGVLPKQIRPADVSKVLYQLHLLPDRRSSEQTSFRPVTVVSEDEASLAPAEPVALTAATLREHFAELRRVLVASLDSQTDRLTGDVDLMLRRALEAVAEDARNSRQTHWTWLAAVAAAIVTLASLLFAWQEAADRRAVTQELVQLRSTAVPAVRTEAKVSATERANSARSTTGDVSKAGATRNAAAPAGAHKGTAANEYKPLIAVVPYGSDPLGAPRLEILRQLFDRLTAQDFRGTVEIKTFPGRFCLMGNATDGFSLAPDEAAFAKCDLVSGVGDEALSQPQRVSLSFANLVEAFRTRTHGDADVQLVAGDASTTVVPYPQISDSLTAGEWNRAGSANNRIEIRVR